jgi:hypothetical protein
MLSVTTLFSFLHLFFLLLYPFQGYIETSKKYIIKKDEGANKMDFHCTIEKVGTYSVSYTKRQLEYYLGERKLFYNDYGVEESGKHKNPTTVVIQRKQFTLHTTLNGITHVILYAIDPYTTFFRFKNKGVPPLNQMESKKLDYLIYEYLYQEPTYRLQLLQEIGPKLTIEEFEKRIFLKKR